MCADNLTCALNKIVRKRTNQLMSEDRKRQAKAWTLVNTGDMDAEENKRSTEDKISKKNVCQENKCIFAPIATHSIANTCIAHASMRLVSRFWNDHGVMIMTRC